MGAKGVNNAAHPPEGSPAENGGLMASNLPLVPFWNLALDQSPAQTADIFASASN